VTERSLGHEAISGLPVLGKRQGWRLRGPPEPLGTGSMKSGPPTGRVGV